jgi:hypothetical protein
MSRESLIKATQAHSLQMDDNHEKAVDRVIAMAYAKDILGSLIIRAMAHDLDAYYEAYTIAANRIRSKTQRFGISANKVAAAILSDMIDQRCKKCGGRGTIEHDQVTKTCLACNGTKIRDTRRNPIKIGGKAIPDEIYAYTYRIYSESYGKVVARTVVFLE